MTKFDEEVNGILARKIVRAKKRIRKNLKKGDPRIRPPNTPGNRPSLHHSPALAKGINKDIADTPMPLSVGV